MSIFSPKSTDNASEGNDETDDSGHFGAPFRPMLWPGTISGPGVNAAGPASPYTGMNRYPTCPCS